MRVGLDEGMVAELEKVGDAAGCPDIAFEGIFFHFELLGWYVEVAAFFHGSALEDGEVVDLHAFGASEISDFDCAVFCQQNVLGFEISVHDSFGTHGYECGNDLLEYVEYFIWWECLLFFDELREISSFTVFHEDAEFLFLSFKVVFVDSDEVGMYKFAHDFELLFC